MHVLDECWRASGTSDDKDVFIMLNIFVLVVQTLLFRNNIFAFNIHNHVFDNCNIKSLVTSSR